MVISVHFVYGYDGLYDFRQRLHVRKAGCGARSARAVGQTSLRARYATRSQQVAYNRFVFFGSGIDEHIKNRNVFCVFYGGQLDITLFF